MLNFFQKIIKNLDIDINEPTFNQKNHKWINIKKRETEWIRKQKEAEKWVKEQNRKTNYKKMVRENVKKGKEYEKYIGKEFEKNGFIVKYNGIEQGKKDSSIDLIAIKNNLIILTQCKNWKKDGRKIKHNMIKAFIGDTYSYIEKNPSYKNYKIKRLFCVANDVFDKSAKLFMNENKKIIEYRIKPFNQNQKSVDIYHKKSVIALGR